MAEYDGDTELELVYAYRIPESDGEMVYSFGNLAGDQADVHIEDYWGRHRHAATDVAVYTGEADEPLTKILEGRVRRPVTNETIKLLAEVALDPQNKELQGLLQQALDQPIERRNR